MNRWTATLPEPLVEPTDWLNHALIALAWALTYERRHDDEALLGEVRRSAAEVRARRKSLPVPGVPVTLTFDGHTDRALIHKAIRSLLDADDSNDPQLLRWSEACLQMLGLRIMDRSE